jgi:hypothetical protein
VSCEFILGWALGFLGAEEFVWLRFLAGLEKNLSIWEFQLAWAIRISSTINEPLNLCRIFG